MSWIRDVYRSKEGVVRFRGLYVFGATPNILVLVVVLDFFPNQQIEDDDDHEDDQEIPLSSPNRPRRRPSSSISSPVANRGRRRSRGRSGNSASSPYRPSSTIFHHHQIEDEEDLGALNRYQGLPWVSQNKRLALKGLEDAHAIRFKDSEPILAVSGGPFWADSGEGMTQGKPWAMLFWPLRATEWNVQITGPSGRMIGAKRAQGFSAGNQTLRRKNPERTPD